MRYSDLKLVETKLNEEDKIADYLAKIDQTAKEKGGMPGDIFARLKKATQDLKADVERILQRQSQKPNDAEIEPVTEDAFSNITPEEVDEYTDFVERMLAPVLQGITDENEISALRDKHVPVYRQIASDMAAAERVKFDKERADFMQAIDDQLARLAQKIDGHVVKDWQAPDVKMTKAQIKKEQTRLNAQQGLMDLFDSLFRNKIKTGQMTEQEALNFAKAAADGKVIDMNKLVNAPDGHGTIDEYVTPKYKKMYDIIIQDLLNSMPAGTGGNVGPGELALAALGNPTEKALEKGDLIIGTGENAKTYEIKGGNFAKGQTQTGGRLNSTQIKDGKSAYDSFQKTLKADKDIWKAMNELAAANELEGKNLVSGFTQAGVRNYEKIFNKAGYNKQKAIEVLDKLIGDIVMNKEEVHEKLKAEDDHVYSDLVDKAVQQSKTGISLNFRDLMKAITFVQYHSYNLADGVQEIMLLNKANRTFTIISNGEDFMSKIDSGHAIPVKALSVTATDPQTASFHWTSK